MAQKVGRREIYPPVPPPSFKEHPIQTSNQRALMSQLIHGLGHEMNLCIVVFNDVGGASISIKLFPGMYLSYQQAYN